MTSTIPDNTVRNTESAGTPHTHLHSSGTPRRHAARHFLRHFAEMTIAMVVGMLLFGPVWEVLASGLGAATGLGLSDVLARPDIGALVMATNMTVGMTIWMRHRAHGWAPVAEMGAAMYVPFLLFLPPYWAGAVSGEFVMMAGHVLMLPAMLLAMFRRLDEYTGGHPAGGHPDPPDGHRSSTRWSGSRSSSRRNGSCAGSQGRRGSRPDDGLG
ncbi:hypothetical protein GCM10022225_24100 [Plantactinospora mayteni]|uniref:Flagellar biosynthetic protein FliP n=1 Tax=Plantactinospora mayteni TaxID=566021 RepID=A0ABQ4EKY3_9ACTN|nr:hypothetical protein [Plantactinospora mayteni]GIG94861.1 hypothetical protein Pma05_14340 [Plantactinospora mayteni]